jgi:ABC-type transporter Mla maintaining outer membrane lipid asymmetry ATPase subunit MlaF
MSAVTIGTREQPGVAVLEDVNWSVGEGEYWVIAGMEASGKTALLSTAAGLMPPLAGRCQLFNQAMPVFGDHFLSDRLRVGLVFDGGHLLHRNTVLENIALPSRYHRGRLQGDLAARIRSILELTELSDRADRLSGAIGRAWQKRAGLARALILQPEVLLLDNPLGGLDSRHVQWWLNFLGQLSAGHPFMGGRPMTLVITAEDLRPWRNRPAWFAILQNGRFSLLGHHPRLAEIGHPLVREMLAEEIQAA